MKFIYNGEENYMTEILSLDCEDYKKDRETVFLEKIIEPYMKVLETCPDSSEVSYQNSSTKKYIHHIKRWIRDYYDVRILEKIEKVDEKNLKYFCASSEWFDILTYTQNILEGFQRAMLKAKIVNPLSNIIDDNKEILYICKQDSTFTLKIVTEATNISCIIWYIEKIGMKFEKFLLFLLYNKNRNIHEYILNSWEVFYESVKDYGRISLMKSVFRGGCFDILERLNCMYDMHIHNIFPKNYIYLIINNNNYDFLKKCVECKYVQYNCVNSFAKISTQADSETIRKLLDNLTELDYIGLHFTTINFDLLKSFTMKTHIIEDFCRLLHFYPKHMHNFMFSEIFESVSFLDFETLCLHEYPELINYVIKNFDITVHMINSIIEKSYKRVAISYDNLMILFQNKNDMLDAEILENCIDDEKFKKGVIDIICGSDITELTSLKYNSSLDIYLQHKPTDVIESLKLYHISLESIKLFHKYNCIEDPILCHDLCFVYILENEPDRRDKDLEICQYLLDEFKLDLTGSKDILVYSAIYKNSVRMLQYLYKNQRDVFKNVREIYDEQALLLDRSFFNKFNSIPLINKDKYAEAMSFMHIYAEDTYDFITDYWKTYKHHEYTFENQNTNIVFQ